MLPICCFFLFFSYSRWRKVPPGPGPKVSPPRGERCIPTMPFALLLKKKTGEKCVEKYSNKEGNRNDKIPLAAVATAAATR